jgi:hypothetical protein
MRSVILALVFIILGSSAAQAERFPVVINGRQHIGHTRRLPVILHKIVPPYKGVHVYVGRR